MSCTCKDPKPANWPIVHQSTCDLWDRSKLTEGIQAVEVRDPNPGDWIWTGNGIAKAPGACPRSLVVEPAEGYEFAYNIETNRFQARRK